MNRDWHRQHVLGQHASREDRIAWHAEHARECACRPIPESLAVEVAQRDAASAGAGAASAADAARVEPGNTAP